MIDCTCTQFRSVPVNFTLHKCKYKEYIFKKKDTPKCGYSGIKTTKH